VVKKLGEAPLAFGLCAAGEVGGFGGEVFAVGSGDDLFDGFGRGFFAGECGEGGRRWKMARGEAGGGHEERGGRVVDGAGGEGAGNVGDELLDVGAVVEAGNLDLRGRAVDGGLAAEVASVGEAVEVTAKGEATAGECIVLALV